MRTISMLGLAMVIGGCTVESEDNNPFASGNPVTSMSPTSGTPDTEGTGDSGNDDEEQTDDGDDESTSNNDDDSATTTGPMGTTTNMSMSASMSMGESSTTDDPPPDGNQPGDGMYSPCTTPEECGFDPELCMTLSMEDGTLIGGFCSQTDCATPAASCDPIPGGTAAATCINITLNGMPESICALDCTGGLTCPPPMTCHAVMGLPDLCV